MTETDNPVRQVVTRFGGPTAFARETGVGLSTVFEWIDKRAVPSRRIPGIIKAGWRSDPPIILQPNDFFCPCLSEDREP